MNEKGFSWISLMAVCAIALGLTFVVMSGVVYITSWAFGFAFEWKYVVGAWVIAIIIKNIIKG